MAKTNAADRTVDMFTGLTSVEAKSPPPAKLDEADTGGPTVRLPETIEQAAERWRNTALFSAEHFSKSYNDSLPGTAKFRLTEKGPFLFLEQFRLGKDGECFQWSGVMFKESDLYELTSVLVRASKDRRAKEVQLVPENGNLPGGAVSVMQGALAGPKPEGP